MMIFDRFPSNAQALAFAREVARRFKLGATIHEDQQSSDAIDPFPWKLKPFIVLVERCAPHIERQVEQLALDFHGTFAGT